MEVNRGVLKFLGGDWNSKIGTVTDLEEFIMELPKLLVGKHFVDLGNDHIELANKDAKENRENFIHSCVESALVVGNALFNTYLNNSSHIDVPAQSLTS